jgi:anti-anti-sigma factor
MPLEVSSRVEESFGIIDLSGPLTLGPSLGNLRENARQLLSGGQLSGVILRVQDVTSTDSSGLGELTVIYTLASKRGYPIRLVGVSSSLHKMLELTRLDGLLPATKDVPTAKAEMRKH